MQIIDFGQRFRRSAESVGRAGNVLRTFRDAVDGVPKHIIFGALQTALGDAKAATVDTIVAAQLDADKANAVLSQFLNGPASIADLQTSAANIQAKADAWNVVFAAWFNAQPLSVAYAFEETGDTGKEYMGMKSVDLIAGPEIDTLRNSQELADLIEAFEAVGG